MCLNLKRFWLFRRTVSLMGLHFSKYEKLGSRAGSSLCCVLLFGFSESDAGVVIAVWSLSRSECPHVHHFF